jgi:ribosomal protein S6--L-glutamate ligase
LDVSEPTGSLTSKMRFMTIAILIFDKSRTAVNSQQDRFTESAKRLCHDVVLLQEPLLSRTKDGAILHDGNPLPALDVIITRPNFIEEPSLRTYAIDLLVDAGYKVINQGAGVGICKNKIAQHILFEQEGIACPKWGLARDPKQALEIACSIGFSVIMKVAFGTHGKGVFFAGDHETFSPIAEYLAIRDGNPVIVECFVEEAERKDLRILIVGGEIIAAMERQAAVGDVRANTSTGGTGYPVKLTDDEVDLAKRAAAAVNLDIVGVDMIRSKRGPLVLEVNANPGFTELERVTGVDVAGRIVRYAVDSISITTK